MNNLTQRADFTYKANIKAGRHGWLRLTPAYGINLVYERISQLPQGAQILEPFSGSATTPLAAAELGYACEGREINPFLTWFGNVKLTRFTHEQIAEAKLAAEKILDTAKQLEKNENLWVPPMHNITRWWNPSALQALAAIRAELDQLTGTTRDLLDVAFCRYLMTISNAAFNHQSMSFKDIEAEEFDHEAFLSNINIFNEITEDIISRTTENEIVGNAHVHLGDSTKTFDDFPKADYVITSPPYANRMSYIRELRPYMYWMRFLSTGAEAGDLDWKAIGGTWGSVGTKLQARQVDESTPIKDLQRVCAKILDGKSGNILAPYVRKYFDDMWSHFYNIDRALNHGANLCYIVGNSMFSGIEVPAHTWYAEMMSQLGYINVQATPIRKRNSNKNLFEYAVTAKKM